MHEYTGQGPALGVFGGIPAAPYAITSPGPREPTAPNHVPASPFEPLWPQPPRPRRPITRAADPYAEAFLNGHPHPGHRVRGNGQVVFGDRWTMSP